MPLLWALRDVLQMTGTRTPAVVSRPAARALCRPTATRCVLVVPLSAIAGKRVVTIEALGSASEPHALQIAWTLHQVPQCGYCQSGMLMAAAALLAKIPRPTDADIDASITNICRCGTYPRIREAIKSAALAMHPAAPAAPHSRRPIGDGKASA